MNERIEKAIETSIAVLSSAEAFSVPDRGSRQKWTGPWWHLAALVEMGEVARIPRSVVANAVEQLASGAWPTFVVTDQDAPKTEADKRLMDCCHCELGVFYMTLSACGCDVDADLPWIRGWFLKRQLPDGGLNCEPGAYLKAGKSSVVSSLPPLEAVLFCTDRDYTVAEAVFLDDGARYLMEHRLVCTKQGRQVINPEWLKPFFPRFFEYDILRGLNYLVEWSRRRCKPLPTEVVDEGIDRLSPYIRDSQVLVGRRVNDDNGHWRESGFSLMESVGGVGEVSPYLTKQLDNVMGRVS